MGKQNVQKLFMILLKNSYTFNTSDDILHD